MEDPTRRVVSLQPRKAEEAASRRSQATQWLERLVGPLGISNQPTEREFISCLRNGLVLCNAINKIQQGSVSKVVENHSPSETLIWDSQPLPAYQYFENVRNFLVAITDLKLQPFDASIFERDDLEVGSSGKVVDCILELKAYDEWKKMSGGIGFYRPQKSPLNEYLAARIHPQSSAQSTFEPRRRLNMSAGPDSNKMTSQSETPEIEGSLVKALAESMIKEKENIDDNLITSFHNGENGAKLLSKILSSFLDEQIQRKSLEDKPNTMNLLPEENTCLEDSSSFGNLKCCRTCMQKGHCNHWQLLEEQTIELSNLKSLLGRTKMEFEDLQSQLQNDLRQLGYQVKEMSVAALGYHKVMKENLNLHNAVQDLKGNIRVYCRIRPAFEDARGLSFIQEDNGSLVIFDPSKPQKEGKNFFQFDHVFSPTTTQDDVFRETKPLIRSVMDGNDVCIFAYGQTGSGKTYTMCGSAKEIGINNQAIDYLFELSNKRKNVLEYQIYVQMVEIFNEKVRDLLAQDTSAKEYSSEIPQATMRLVKFSGDVIKVMNTYERTGRCHRILTVHVHSKDLSENIHRSHLHLVDLAGSERVDRYQDTENEFTESPFTNKSVSCLGDLLTALARKNTCIPYKNSKLTLLLQNTLGLPGGHTKTLMIAHVIPEEDCFGETMTTLKFAQRLSCFELGAAGQNKDSTDAIELKEQIVSLKRALEKKEAAKSSVQIKTKEKKSPLAKSKSAIADKSPLRSRRWSIENCSNITNAEKKPPNSTIPEKTPPRSRRLSIENGSHSIIKSEKKPLTSAILCKTPPGSTRLNIEKVSYSRTKTEKKLPNPAIPDTTPLRSTRVVNAESNNNSITRTERKLPNTEIKNRTTKIASVTTRSSRRLSLEGSRNNLVTTNVTQSVTDARRLKSPAKTPVPKERGSKIKRSLQSIGKLINGSEKKNQMKETAVSSPFNVTSSIHGKSPAPTPASGRLLRRQSLTGLHISPRSSLGENSQESCGNDDGSVKAPPRVPGSAKPGTRWL